MDKKTMFRLHAIFYYQLQLFFL